MINQLLNVQKVLSICLNIELLYNNDQDFLTHRLK